MTATAISIGGSDKIFGALPDGHLLSLTCLHVNVAARYNSNTETLDGYSIDTDLGDFGDGYDEPSDGYRGSRLHAA